MNEVQQAPPENDFKKEDEAAGFADIIKKQIDFNGRTRRMNYWMYSIITSIVFIMSVIIDNLTYAPFNINFFFVKEKGGYVFLVWLLLTIIPTLAISVRRLHDTNKSGLWLFVSIIPIVGNIILFIFFLMKGDEGANQYGPDPKPDED